MGNAMGRFDRAAWKAVAVCGVFLTAAIQTEAQDSVRVANRDVGARKGAHALDPAIRLAKASQEGFKAIKDYEAEFLKKELVGNEMVNHRIHLKLREKPFSVYMHFLEAHQGREVIYVEGQNGGNLLAHEGGVKALAGTFTLEPTCETAMQGNRYPITLVGMSNLLGKIIQQWEASLQFDDVDVKFFPNAKLGNVECKAIQTTIPTPRNGVEFHMTRLYLDKANNLPVRLEQYGFPQGGKPPLIEEYSYTNVKTNVGLTDADFDKNNPRYAY